MKQPKTNDPRGGHARLYWDLIDSPAWRSLTATDQRAYMALLRQKLSFNNGDLSLPFTFARHHGITNEGTLAKNLRALMAVGLVAITRRTAHKMDGTRLCNLYRLTDYPVNAMPAKFIEAGPATNEWKQVQSIGHGRGLIREAEARAKQEAKAKRERSVERAEKLASQGLKK